MAEKEGNWFKRHKILTVIIVLIVIGVVASAAGGSNGSTGNQSSNGEQQSTETSSDDKKATVAKIGEPARDGKFEFTVKSVKCGEKTVGDQYFNRKAQGQFCRVNVSVKNIGDESQTLDSSSQYAYSSEGKKYSSDDEAALYATADNNATGAWYNEINPGNTVKGDIFFDVPTGVKLTKIELHDSAFSNGIEVDLK